MTLLNEQASYFDINNIIIRSGGNQGEALFKYAISRDSSDHARMVYFESMAKVYSRRGDTDEALNIKKQGLELAEKLKDTEFIITYNSDIANLYIYQNLPDKALYHLNIAQSMAEDKRYATYNANIFYNRGLLENLFNNIEGQHYSYMKMWESAKELENTSRKTFLSIYPGRFSESDRLSTGLGQIYRRTLCII